MQTSEDTDVTTPSDQHIRNRVDVRLGKGFRIKSERKVRLTEAFATEILELKELPFERALRTRHAANLAAAMKAGEFRGEQTQILIGELPGGGRFRINGNHTCTARLLLRNPPTHVDQIEVREIVYSVSSMNDMRELYAQTDQAAPRTKAHQAQAYLVGIAQLEGVSDLVMRALPSAFALWQWPDARERAQFDGAEIGTLIRSGHIDLVAKVAAFLDKYEPGERRHTMRAPVIAAMFATFDKAPRDAAQFWDPVISGLGLHSKHDPRKRLNELLSRSVIKAGSGRHAASSEGIYRACIMAWNAQRSGDNTQQLRRVEAGARPEVE